MTELPEHERDDPHALDPKRAGRKHDPRVGAAAADRDYAHPSPHRDEAARQQRHGDEEGAQHEASGGDLNSLAFSATTHCLIGCVIGEVAGMMLATAFGWGDVAQIGLAVGLAYVFGFSLTARPLVKAGLAFGTVVSTALAADTVSVTIMEVIDNVFIALVPGALDAEIDDPLLYGSIAVGFAIAYPVAFAANRYMIARGKGHAVVHEYHH